MPVYIYFDTATYDVIERDVKVKNCLYSCSAHAQSPDGLLLIDRVPQQLGWQFYKLKCVGLLGFQNM